MNDVLARISAFSLVPVVVADSGRGAAPLADALIAGGLPVAEVTLRTPRALEVIEALAVRGDILVGAGTVLNAAQVDSAVDAGAAFIVSPGLSRGVVERALERGAIVLPGVATATEIQAALELGLAAVKFFPAQTSGGAAAISALAAPFPDLKFVPTGGIGPANLADYLALPAVAAVGGSWMVPRDLVAAEDVARLSKLIAGAVALARASRPH
jgi:2-dehydro-3-deoxyphosphogluconate aldolase/(4S)-4-hydroxy-2-oxoglutarate aldolase